MGSTASGILFYGYAPEFNKYGEPVDEWAQVYKASNDRYSELQQVSKRLGVDVVLLGHYDFTVCGIALIEPDYDAEWSTAILIEPDKLLTVATPENEARLQEYAKEIGLDVGDRKPAWFLSSRYS